MQKIEKDMVISMVKLCANLLPEEKNVSMDNNVLIHIQEWNNFTNTKHTKKNFALITLTTSPNANTDNSVPLLTPNRKYGSNSFTTTSLMKISTSSTIKLNSALSTSPNTTKRYVSMLITYKTIAEIPQFISMNQYHATTGN